MNFILTLVMAFGAYAGDTTQIQILNENLEPVIGADVLIGSAEPGDKLVTDQNGMVAIPTSWKSAQPVTVSAAGYIKATFLDVQPTDLTLQVHKADQKGVMEVQGDTTNYANLKKDGKVDFALVYPGLKLRQLSQFDVQSVINPDSDIIKIMSETAAVPSNLSIPSQKETYILPITLEKPIYRMSFKQVGDYRLMAMHGQFPLSQVVGDLRNGKSFYEVINHFRIIGGGQKDISVDRSITGQNIPVNQLVLNQKISVKGAPLTADQVMFSFALAKQGELYFPTDIKRLMPNETLDLVLPTNSTENSIISILMPKGEAGKIGGTPEDAASQTQTDSPIAELKSIFNGFLHLFNINFSDDNKVGNIGIGGLSSARHLAAETTPTFLDLISRPTLSENQISMTPPKLVEGIEPVATYAMLSEIERTPKGKYTIEHRFRVLEVTRLGWTDQIQIPAGTLSLIPGKLYRWDILYMGRRSGKINSGEYFLDGITHVTRNSIDF